jgi:hypothetical protein
MFLLAKQQFYSALPEGQALSVFINKSNDNQAEVSRLHTVRNI